MSGEDGAFAGKMLEWFERHGRHDLPWQRNVTPYRVWISEVMLQQTQVATVIPYYRRFLRHFPDIDSLANAQIDRVLQYWQGLGYYARARNLHRSARIIRDQYQGRFPQDIDEVRALPGIGRSTAAAILTFACRQSWPILDGNVRRVLARCFQVSGWYGQSGTERRLWGLSEEVTPTDRTAEFNQAMMDLGSTICLRTNPLCEQCPLDSVCLSSKYATQHRYPQKKAKIARPNKSTLMLLHRYQNQVLLIRRPPTGIWGGLWSLPEVGEVKKINDWQKKYLSIPAPLLSISENVTRHQFSHFSLDISVASFDLNAIPAGVSDGDNIKFTPLDKLAEFALPTPVRRILDQMAITE